MRDGLISKLSDSYHMGPFSVEVFYVTFSTLIFSPPSPFSADYYGFSVFSRDVLHSSFSLSFSGSSSLA